MAAAGTLFGLSLVTSGRRELTILGFGNPSCTGKRTDQVSIEEFSGFALGISGDLK